MVDFSYQEMFPLGEDTTLVSSSKSRTCFHNLF